MLIFLYIVLGLSIIALIAALLSLFFLLKTRVPFVRTPLSAIPTIVEQLPPKSGLTIYDLGSGDGSVLYGLEKVLQQAKLIGYELSPAAFLQAKAKRWLKKSNVKLYYQDFYKVDLVNADVIFCFLIASVMPGLEKKLRAELKPGALVISYGFVFPDWQPTKVLDNPDPKRRSKINIYKQD